MTAFRGYGYYASKAAMNMYTRALAWDPARHTLYAGGLGGLFRLDGDRLEALGLRGVQALAVTGDDLYAGAIDGLWRLSLAQFNITEGGLSP